MCFEIFESVLNDLRGLPFFVSIHLTCFPPLETIVMKTTATVGDYAYYFEPMYFMSTLVTVLNRHRVR